MNVSAAAAPVDTARPTAAPPAPATGFAAAFAAVLAGQLGRARVARGSLLFVATVQSVGILLLLRGVVDTGSAATRAAVVAGASVLVVAFVGVNLLAQRTGVLRATRALDYYAALPVPPAAVVLALSASYAAFAVPGTLLTGVLGALLYGLPLASLWALVPVVVLSGAGLSGLGAWLGLTLPRPELATVAGQLGMTVVLFAGVVPPQRMPYAARVLRDAVPSTYAVDALAAAFAPHPDWWAVGWRLAVTAGIALVALALATRAFRRTAGR